MRVRVVSSTDIGRCPRRSLLPSHYRDDGSCRCGEDAQWDTIAAAWNAALATGDPDVIAAAQRTALDEIHNRIMDDDPNYAAAGRTPTAGAS